jgi:hypothetical protein
LDHAGVFTQGEKEEAYWRVFVPFEHRSSEISSFTLFDAPPEWEVSKQGKIEPTRPGVLYGIAVTTSGYSLGDGGTRSRVTGLNFTTEDLDRLGTDEVLVTTETYEAVPMSEGDFYAQGRKSC